MLRRDLYKFFFNSDDVLRYKKNGRRKPAPVLDDTADDAIISDLQVGDQSVPPGRIFGNNLKIQ